MKLAPLVIVLAIIFGVAYGVVFSAVYPQIEIYGGLVSLFGLLGLLTALILAGIWQAVLKRKRATPDEPQAE